ncbi:hypothetical protein Aph02nite_79870 [Actinoplanes philippinensis]|nr:hypothetical protein Aph02nite_79870 [Actinoplanes philippinensis]
MIAVWRAGTAAGDRLVIVVDHQHVGRMIAQNASRRQAGDAGAEHDRRADLAGRNRRRKGGRAGEPAPFRGKARGIVGRPDDKLLG